MIDRLLLLLLLNLCYSLVHCCEDDNGKRRRDGEEWQSLDSFVVRCMVHPDGSWKAKVLRCVTHSGSPVEIGSEKVEDGHSYRCLLDGSQVRIRVRPVPEDNFVRPLPATVAPVRTTPEPIPNVLCYMQGYQEPYILGQEVAYGNGVIECGFNGTFRFTACLLPDGSRLPIGRERRLGPTLHQCQTTRDGVVLASAPQQTLPSAVTAATAQVRMQLPKTVRRAPAKPTRRGSELRERLGCVITGRTAVASPGEEVVVDNKLVFLCRPDGVARIKACVLPSVDKTDSPNAQLDVGEKQVFQGYKHQCKRLGGNSAALLSIPATEAEAASGAAKEFRLLKADGDGPRQMPAARLFLSSKSWGRRGGRMEEFEANPMTELFDCPLGNLTLIKQGIQGGFVKQCTERSDGLRGWTTAFCYTPEGEWLTIGSSKTIGDRSYVCSAKADGRVSLRVDGPRGPADPTINSIKDLFDASGRTATPRPKVLPSPGRRGPSSLIPGCRADDGVTRGNGERWHVGNFVMACGLRDGTAMMDVVACLTPSKAEVALGAAATEGGVTWRCSQNLDGSPSMESGKGASGKDGQKVDADYAHCVSKDGRVKLRVGKRLVKGRKEYQCRYQNGLYTMMEKNLPLPRPATQRPRSRTTKAWRKRYTTRRPRRYTTRKPRTNTTRRPRKRWTTKRPMRRWTTRRPRRRWTTKRPMASRKRPTTRRPRRRWTSPRPRPLTTRRPRRRTTPRPQRRSSACVRSCTQLAEGYPGDARRKAPRRMCDEELQLLEAFDVGDSMLRCRNRQIKNFCIIERDGKRFEEQLGWYTIHDDVDLTYCATLVKEGNVVKPELIRFFRRDPDTNWLRTLGLQGFKQSKALQPFKQ